MELTHSEFVVVYTGSSWQPGIVQLVDEFGAGIATQDQQWLWIDRGTWNQRVMPLVICVHCGGILAPKGCTCGEGEGS